MGHITDADMFRCVSHHPQGSHIRTLGKQLEQPVFVLTGLWNRSCSVFVSLLNDLYRIKSLRISVANPIIRHCCSDFFVYELAEQYTFDSYVHGTESYKLIPHC
jgi:hypothetical protein